MSTTLDHFKRVAKHYDTVLSCLNYVLVDIEDAPEVSAERAEHIEQTKSTIAFFTKSRSTPLLPARRIEYTIIIGGNDENHKNQDQEPVRNHRDIT